MTENNSNIRIIESARDAMQALPHFIPTSDKIAYINKLVTTGFDIVDFGSFVSPKAIPQMKDSEEVVQNIDLQDNCSLLVVVGNKRGFETACKYDYIRYVGFPFSISNTFLQLNINSDIDRSLTVIEDMQHVCACGTKEVMIYLSMAFGNPYGDEWSLEMLAEYTGILAGIGIREINLSDTIGIGTPELIMEVFQMLVPRFPEVTFGLHLHTRPHKWFDKLEAAYNMQCRSFDSVLNGLGGCPMTQYELVGNLDTLNLFSFFEEKNIQTSIEKNKLLETAAFAGKILYS